MRNISHELFDLLEKALVRCVLAATPNQHSSGQRRRCSTSTIDNESMALMQWPSVLSAPTSMCHFYTSKAILHPPHTTRRYEVVLAATQKQPTPGQRRGCSTSTIDNESMALMQWPSALSAPTSMCHFYTSKAILQPPHTTRRYEVVLAATLNQPSSGLCGLLLGRSVIEIIWVCLSYYY